MQTPFTSPSGNAIATQPPGPRPIPLFGNAFQMQGKDVLQAYIDLWRRYGDIVHIRFSSLNAYVLAHPEHVHHVMVKNQKNYIKGVGYDTFRLLVGQGLVTSEGALWQQQRRLMQPSFTPTATTRFATMMVDVTQQMLDRWQTAADQGQVLHMDTEMTQLTMSIIGRAMFGIDLSDEMSEVGRAFQEAFAFIPQRNLHPLPLPLTWPLPQHRRFNRNLQIIEQFIAARIAEGRRQPNDDTLLGILLRAKDEETAAPMSAQQLRDEVVTLFFAGFETTARSLTWAWYCLGRYPEVAAKLTAEVDQVLGNRRPVLEDLFKLRYTRMVVDEVLRVYPPTPLLGRQTLEDDVIGGYAIPARSMVIPMPYLVHRHPSAWHDGDRFDPERFAAEAVEQRPKFAYIPFASGPRVCLGNNFALLEMVLALAMVAARYRLELASATELLPEYTGTIRPNHPVMIKISRR